MSRAWEVSETWVANDEEQLFELQGGESDGSVRALVDDSDDEPEDAREYLDFANFPVPDEPSSDEEGGGADHVSWLYRGTSLIRNSAPP